MSAKATRVSRAGEPEMQLQDAQAIGLPHGLISNTRGTTANLNSPRKGAASTVIPISLTNRLAVACARPLKNFGDEAIPPIPVFLPLDNPTPAL
jgi:hypothetical protein